VVVADVRADPVAVAALAEEAKVAVAARRVARVAVALAEEAKVEAVAEVATGSLKHFPQS
jgi:hypothetical protein